MMPPLFRKGVDVVLPTLIFDLQRGHGKVDVGVSALRNGLASQVGKDSVGRPGEEVTCLRWVVGV